MTLTPFDNYIQTTKPTDLEGWYAIPKAVERLDPITIRVNKEVLDQIDEVANQKRISRASFIRLAICRNLRYHQDVEKQERETKPSRA
jgi:hypothetical protein